MKQYLLISWLMSVGIVASILPVSEVHRGQITTDCHEQGRHDCSCDKCCKKLRCEIARVEDTLNTCCTNLANDIAQVNSNLTTCCNTIESQLETIIGTVTTCGTITAITQADIPLEITQSGRYCLAEDIFVDGTTIPAGAFGPIGIAINAPNVDLDLNEHTVTFTGGAGTNVILTLAQASNVLIHNGTVLGTGSPADEACIAVGALTNDVTISDVQIKEFNALLSAGIFVQGLPLTSPTTDILVFAPRQGVTIERCNVSTCYYGALLAADTYGTIIRDCTFDQNVLAGIAQPERTAGYVNNTLIENCSISNTTFHGIYTTFYQSNWILKNVQVSNSGLSGMVLAGFQSLKLQNCQVFNSGSYGIIASIRLSENIEISDCQVFNAKNGALRVDNVANLLISNCQLTNYLASPEPLLKVQDVFNGSISGCLLSSFNGTDAFFARNCHGLKVDNCAASIFCNQPLTNCPIGFNIHGGVSNAIIQNSSVSGNPSIGIAVVPDGFVTPPCDSFSQPVTTIIDNLNGNNFGCTVSNCKVTGAVRSGVYVSGTSTTSITDCTITDGNCDGITLDNTTSQIIAKGNTLTNNLGVGLNNQLAISTTCPLNQAYGNFASCNGTNYQGIAANLISAPSATAGVLTNISVN